MFDNLKSILGFSSKREDIHLDAASQLAPVAPPKVKPGSQSYPSYLKSTTPSDSTLPLLDRRLASLDTTTLRYGATTRKTIADFVAASPDLSAAVWSYVRLGLPQKYMAVAKNPDNTFNREATQLAQDILTRFNMLPDYSTDGFTGPQSVRAVSESLARDLIMQGGCCGEVVLDKARLPKRVQPISVTQIEFSADVKDKSLRPVQNMGSEKIDLDYPTFLYVTLDQNLLEPYSESPIQSAIKPVIYSESFSNTITRLVDKVIHPRQMCILDEEKIRKGMSQEAQMDNSLAATELNTITSALESKINGLKPEDALVLLDSIKFEVQNTSNAGLSAEYETLQNMANARLSTGSKTNGTVLGYSAGSSNIASAEIMLFVRSCTGAVKAPVEEFWSRALTLAVRLFAHDVVVEFTFDPIDLRPEAELAAFKQTQQAMTIELLSLGFLTDDEAALRLTGKLTPPGFKPLSGTMFKDKKAEAGGVENPSNNGSTLNQNLAPETPDTGRGQNRKAEIVHLVNEA